MANSMSWRRARGRKPCRNSSIPKGSDSASISFRMKNRFVSGSEWLLTSVNHPPHEARRPLTAATSPTPSGQETVRT